jgi:HK97 family phage major capsid protein
MEAMEQVKTLLTENRQLIEGRMADLKRDNDDLRDRVEELESRQKSVKTTANREQREHMALFTKWMRRPHDARLKAQLAEFESKSVNLGTGAEGAFAMPEEISRDIVAWNFYFRPCVGW